MSNSKQVDFGKSTENEVVKLFRGHKYWVYLTPRKTNGQPVDIIAIRKHVAFLVDAKHVNEKKVSFSFDDIQPNQITSMQYAHHIASLNFLGFAIQFDRDKTIRLLSFDKYQRLVQKGAKSVNMKDLFELEKFLKIIDNYENNNK